MSAARPGAAGAWEKGRDHPRLSGRLLGSVTASLLHNPTCPVAVVPPRCCLGQRRPLRPIGPTWPSGRRALLEGQGAGAAAQLDSARLSQCPERRTP
ncbi:universal stress protein [Asanoa sp. NPDC049573]|uniref:universal stress protein n=1 Tax=Asanoa sp. NPDC049573 TaxID=3155396 RepID=UPI00343234E8